MVIRRAWAMGATGLLFALGCQDLLGLTPGKPGGTGGDVASGGSGGAGGTSNPPAGAGGEHSECPADCVSTACAKAECGPDGECVLTVLKKDEVIEDAVPGDCVADVYCDAEGHLIDGAFTDKDADDDNDCTWDACAGGMVSHPPRQDGTVCGQGAGVCQGGQCQLGECTLVPLGVKSGNETDIDCGGTCDPCDNGKGCLVASDCASGFCASKKCAAEAAVGVTHIGGFIRLATFVPGANPAWKVAADDTMWNNLGLAGASFDAAGEAVALLRHTTGARSARWAAGAWSAIALWSVPSSHTWAPAFARTDSALYFFAQNTNLEHLYAPAGGVAGGPFLSITHESEGEAIGASGTLSGAATTRNGHASFFFAPGTDRLVEMRYLLDGGPGKWSAPETVLSGNYADGSPAAAATDLGTLVVAARREGNDHLLDWLLVSPGGTKSGTIPGAEFISPAPAPRRLSLAPRNGGGAILAFRDGGGRLRVWLAGDDGSGGLTWTPDEGLQGGEADMPLINTDPAVARGLKGAQAELLWVLGSSPAKLRHSSLNPDGTWSIITDVASGNIGAIALATP